MRLFTGVFGLLFKLYVGVVFVSFLLLFYPLFLIALSRKEWRKYSFPINRIWSYLMRFFMGIWILKKGVIPDVKVPAMIIANHTSYLDIFMMYSLLPSNRFLFMGKSELLSYPLLNVFFKRLNIPVFRDDKRKAAMSFIQAKQALAEGWSIVIFPEGGIPDEQLPSMIPFKSGAFKLAKSAKVPIIPITFLDHYHLFSDPTQVLGPAHPGISTVHFHPVIDAKQVSELSEVELSDLVFTTISAPLEERGHEPIRIAN